MIKRPQPIFVARNHFDAVGTDIQTRIKGTEDRCIELCRGTPSCVGYTYDRWNNECHTKSNIWSLRLEAKAVSGFREGFSIPDAASSEVRIDRLLTAPGRLDNRRLEGNLLATVSANSPEDCRANCLNDRQCMGVTYKSASRECRKFSQVDNHFEDNSGTLTSAVKRQ